MLSSVDPIRGYEQWNTEARVMAARYRWVLVLVAGFTVAVLVIIALVVQ